MAKSKINVVLERLDDIRRWKAAGATDKQICKALGISKTSFYAYKAANSDFSDTLRKGTAELVLDLRGELARQAKPHVTVTKKNYIREENGVPVKYVEEVRQEHDGNIKAISLLLNNLDRENWKENWDNYEFKQLEYELHKQEFEFKKELEKNKEW
jgi:hypothetical protein